MNVGKSYEDDVKRMKKEDKLKHRLSKDYWRHLRPYLPDVFRWVDAGASKRMVYRLFIKKHPTVKNVSPDRLYRMVCHARGGWPRPRKKHRGEN